MAYIDIDLTEFTDQDLLDEIQTRGLASNLDLNTKEVDADDMRMLLELVWQKRRLGQDYQVELDQAFYYGLGKIL